MKAILMDKFEKDQIGGKDLPDFDVGDTVRVHQRIKEAALEQKLSKTAKAVRKAKEEETGKIKGERVQVFEGVVLAKKHGRGLNATFTVRKVIGPYGVEKIYPLHSPTIEKIEVVRKAKVRRSKLYYLRNLRGKKAKLKERVFTELVVEEEKPIAPIEEIQEGQEAAEGEKMEVAGKKEEVKTGPTENTNKKETKEPEKKTGVSKLLSKFKKP